MSFRAAPFSLMVPLMEPDEARTPGLYAPPPSSTEPAAESSFPAGCADWGRPPAPLAAGASLEQAPSAALANRTAEIAAMRRGATIPVTILAKVREQ
jgi:hypothetical protein